MLLLDKIKADGKEYEDCRYKDPIWIQCDYCKMEFIKKKKGYLSSKKTCITDKDCCSKIKCKQQKSRESCLKKYGVESHFSDNGVKAKIKAHNQEKYGVDYTINLKEIRDKSKKTNLKRYGKESYSQTNEYKEKMIVTSLERYGTTSPMKNNIIVERVKKTNQERYGVDNVFQTPEVKDKIKIHNQEKYGVDHFINTNEYKEKMIATSLERYGTTIPILNKEIREKVQQSCFKNFGTKTPLENIEFKRKCNKIFEDKYGVVSPFSLPEIQEKIKLKFIEKYGTSCIGSSSIVRKKIIETCMSLYGRFPPISKFGKTENQIKDWINSFGFSFTSNWDILENREIDLYDINTKIGIEYCGLYWHNEQSPGSRGENYHYDKYKRCLNKNVTLLTIFEDEWKNKQIKCKNIIKSILGKFDRRIYGRKCKIKEISLCKGNAFLEENHLDGKTKSKKIILGLFHKEELVGVISLGKKYKKGIILDRLCFKLSIQIIGGASKLFNDCVKWANINGYNEIFTWTDNRWGNGNIWGKLNFTSVDLPPKYSYVDIKSISRTNIIKEGCPLEIEENKWMVQNGFGKIWDCGSKEWSYKVSNSQPGVDFKLNPY